MQLWDWQFPRPPILLQHHERISRSQSWELCRKRWRFLLKHLEYTMFWYLCWIPQRKRGQHMFAQGYAWALSEYRRIQCSLCLELWSRGQLCIVSCDRERRPNAYVCRSRIPNQVHEYHPLVCDHSTERPWFCGRCLKRIRCCALFGQV